MPLNAPRHGMVRRFRFSKSLDERSPALPTCTNSHRSRYRASDRERFKPDPGDGDTNLLRASLLLRKEPSKRHCLVTTVTDSEQQTEDLETP